MASGCSLVPWPGEADEVADQVELHWVCWDLPGPDTWIGRATRLDKELCLVYAHPGTRRDYSAGTSDLSPRLRTAVWGEVVALPGRPTVVVLVRRVSVERFSEGRGGLRLAGRIQAPGLRRRPGATWLLGSPGPLWLVAHGRPAPEPPLRRLLAPVAEAFLVGPAPTAVFLLHDCDVSASAMPLRGSRKVSCGCQCVFVCV